jgi:ribosomal protein L33
LSDEEIRGVVSFLCSESGSHDYTTNRREAEKDLRLRVEKPTDGQYKTIKSVYDDVSSELEFGSAFNPAEINGAYSARRSLLESIDGGSDYFVTEGVFSHFDGPNGESLLQNGIVFQGWRHDSTDPEDQLLKIANEKGDVEY